MKLFISYAHTDEPYRIELEKHLSNLRDQKLITDWHDRKIVPGQNWAREIDSHLETASVMLLLVSSDFMHSRYCSEREMARALARHDEGDAVVIPVIIRPVDFQDAPFSHLQALPTDAKPVSRWDDHDEAWVDVVRGIRKVIVRMRERRAAPGPSPVPKPPRRKSPPQPTDPKILGWLGDEGQQLRKAFIQVFGENHRAFGSRARRIGGLSDGNEGVQWNAGYNPDTGEAWVGVNLEGMQYRGWPVARLIQRELQTPTLPALVRQLHTGDSVVVRWRRDYWQAASRPPIEEKDIAPTPIPAGQLTEDLWRKALEEAARCLDATKPGGGRATREVTLSVSKERVTGPVSPHLTILVPSPAPYEWELYFSRTKAQLQPFYDWAVQQAAPERKLPDAVCDDFASFMHSVVLPRRTANPDHIRLDGATTGGSFEVTGQFWYNGRRWIVHADTHYEPLLIACAAAEEGIDPFVEEDTARGRSLALIPGLRAKQRSRHKHLYIYSWSGDSPSGQDDGRG